MYSKNISKNLKGSYSFVMDAQTLISLQAKSETTKVEPWMEIILKGRNKIFNLFGPLTKF